MGAGRQISIGRRIREGPLRVKPKNLIFDKDLAQICHLM